MRLLKISLLNALDESGGKIQIIQKFIDMEKNRRNIYLPNIPWSIANSGD